MAKDFQGKVIDVKENPISFVVVFNKAENKFTYTDSDGEFSVQINSFPCKLEFSILGYRTKVVEVANENYLKIHLEEESLQLPGIVVTAELRKSDKGTSVYRIGNQAIKQVQAMSLGDILAVLPGNTISPPSMTGVQQFSIRTSENSRIDAFTSKIIVDGVSLSNDANLQAYNPAQGIFGGKSAVGGGVDLRAITPESIESIEVVSGVPSVKYGNIASGAVLIKRKTTPQDLTLNCSLNATNYQVGIHHGIQLPNNDVFSYNLSGTYATLSPTQQKDCYHALSGTLLWRSTFSKKYNWENTLTASAGYGINSKDFEEEDLFKNDEKFTSKNLSLSLAGDLDLGVKLDYLFSADIRKQYSFHDTQENNGPLPMLEGMETGIYKVPFSPFVYRLQEEIIGMPINIQAQINGSNFYQRGDFKLVNKAGIQFSYDKNIGEGRVGGKSVVGSFGAIGSRAAKFREIPALRMLSAYYEAKTTYSFSDTQYVSLTSGLRYDNVNTKYNLWSPRFSFYSQLSDRIRLRAAWGISYKAPALLHLYPGPSYIDFTNMSFFSENKKERMGLITTTKMEQNNNHLKPIKGETVELGIDVTLEKYGQFRLTLFDKKIEGGIISSPELLILSKQNYKVTQRYPDKMPDVAPIEGDVQKIMLSYNRMKNDIAMHTFGAELVFNSKKIEATQTSFDFQLSLLKTEKDNNAFKMVNSQYTIGDKLSRIGVYENPIKEHYKGIGSFTVIQHIPSLSMILTLRTELNLYDYYTYEDSPIYPIGYYTRENKYISFSDTERVDAANKDLFLPKGTYNSSLKPPFYPNFHLQARKELKGGSSLQFYVHNFLWHTPTYEQRGVRWSLNSDIYFGLGLTINL